MAKRKKQALSVEAAIRWTRPIAAEYGAEDEEVAAEMTEDEVEAEMTEDEEVDAEATEDEVEAEVTEDEDEEVAAEDDEEVEAEMTEDEVEAEVAEDEVEAALPTFEMVAYTGNAMKLSGWDAPVVVDLAGLKWTNKPRPILKDHNPDKIVGHTSDIAIRGNALIVSGVVSADSACAHEVVRSGKNGFPWQASIGADAASIEFIAEGETGNANGETFDGPVYISRKTVLGEVSFVALGADDATESRVAASAAKSGASMMQNKKQAAKVAPEKTGDPVADIRASAAREVSRIAEIRQLASDHPSIAATAIAEGWSSTKTELEVLRAERAEAPAAIVRKPQGINASSDKVLEAAAAKTARLPNLDKAYSQDVLEATDALPNLGLQELLLAAAQRNGFEGRSVKADTRGALRAAFSTMSLPGIFSNLANKFLLQGFMAVDQTWRSIASIRSVTDFKTVTSYRLNGGFEFAEIGAGGELQHGSVGEETYTNAAKTYGKMFAITREDIINDDLGALAVLPQRIGRGAALKMNSVFWSTFVANTALFTTGNKNLVTSNPFGTGIDALTKAEQAFLDQVDPDGNPLALMPQFLLVPTGLYAQASVAMASAEVRNPSGKDLIGNPHAGKFQVLTTPYLSAAAIPGSSATSWYLLTAPADLAMIECAFLNGNEQPIVEQAEADFSTLGVQMRGYFDFGVALQDPRAAVKNTA